MLSPGGQSNDREMLTKKTTVKVLGGTLLILAESVLWIRGDLTIVASGLSEVSWARDTMLRDASTTGPGNSTGDAGACERTPPKSEQNGILTIPWGQRGAGTFWVTL